MRSLRAAVSLLTRVPTGITVEQEDLARSVPWFPVVGAGIGLVLALAYHPLARVLPPLLAATSTVMLGIIVTGALHEDGLADTADGIGSGKEGEEALEIMRQPTLGSYGVSALAIGLLLRVGAVSAISSDQALAFLPLAHLAGRAGMVVLVTTLPPVPGGGLAAAHHLPGKRPQGLAAAALTLAAGALAAGWAGVWIGLASLAAAGGVGLVAMRRLHGISGDVLGASEQVGEVVVLVAVAALAKVGL